MILSKLSILSFGAATYTAFKFPHTRETALIAATCGILPQVINDGSAYIINRYPYYLNRKPVTETVFYLRVISKFALYSVAAKKFLELSQINMTSSNTIASIISTCVSGLFNASFVSVRAGLVLGSAGIIACSIFGSFLIKAVKNGLRQVEESPMVPLFTRALNELNNGRNFSVDYNGVHIFSTNPAIVSPIDEEELERVAPLRCPGLKNDNRDNFTKNNMTCPDECSLCMEIYSEKQLSRTLPCAHSFHAHCVDKWLIVRSATCPLCRRSLITEIVQPNQEQDQEQTQVE